MSRLKAIKKIVSNWEQADSEFCCSQGERDWSRLQMIESLVALGVTPEEIEEARKVA